MSLLEGTFLGGRAPSLSEFGGAIALSHRAASSLWLGQEPEGLSGLHSARSSYLAVSSSPSTPRSTKINWQNAAPALHSPQMKVILQTSGRCLGKVQGHLDSLLQKMLPLEGGLVCVKSQNSCCPAPTFLGSEDAEVGLCHSAPRDSRGPSHHRHWGGGGCSQQLGPHVETACH